MSSKEIKQIIREAEDLGWEVNLTNNGHYKCQHPSGGLIFMASTPSDRRALRNIRNYLRKMQNRKI